MMAGKTLNHPYQRVRVADMQAYLVSHGWRSEPFPRREELKFSMPTSACAPEGVSLLIPASEGLRDYSDRVELMVNSLSVLEDRDPSDVLWDMLSPTCDKLDIRLNSVETRTGSLPLGFATRFFIHVKDLLTFAACAEMDSRRYIPKPFREAVAFADECRLARMFAGSFQVSIESPLPPPASEKQRQIRAYPKQRRIVQGLMDALIGMRRAHDSGQVESFIETSDVHLNANICDALLGMRPASGDAELELRAVWNHAWPAPERPDDSSVRFDDRALETVAAIGDALRTDQDAGPVDLYGKVVGLSTGSPLEAGNGANSVTIRTENLSRPMNVEIKVTKAEYQQAIVAHQKGKTISAQGVLERRGRKAILRAASRLRVIDE